MKYLLAFLLFLTSSAAFGQSAFPGDFGYKQAIVIQSTKIDAALTDFTVLVTRDMLNNAVVDPSGGTASQADGGDVRFSSDAAGSTQLACDVISWEHDSVTAAGDAEILVAVKVSSISDSANTTIYIWYDTVATDTQPAASNTYGSDNAYDSSWFGFWPAAGTTDRTSNNADLTASGAPTVGGAVGPAGLSATDFNGSSQYMSLTTGVPTAAPLTLISWGEPDVEGANITSVAIADTAGGDNYFALSWWGITTNDPIVAISRNGGTPITATKTDFDTSWQHAAATLDTSSRVAYLNGVAGTEDTTSVTPAGIDAMSVGALRRSTLADYYNGSLALVSIHTTIRSAAWIKADYEQINSPSAFGVAGTPEANSSGPAINPISSSIPGSSLDPIRTTIP